MPFHVLFFGSQSMYLSKCGLYLLSWFME
uniref:Uncharacterized protein n=1 Tax=Arundo donax TaxID=35708 RepID=A0A0A9BXE7_ARUDO